MKRIALTFLAFLAPLPLLAQPFPINAATHGGGPAADSGEGVALDDDGSHYVVGTFEGTAAFGDLSITSAGDSDFFLVKYDASLTPLWARRGGTDVFNDFGTAVAVAPDGSVYTAGYFTGIATWDGGANPDVELTTFSDFDAFVAKYTPDGDLAWVRQGGGTGQDTARDLAVDADGNVYLVGGFEGTGTFGSDVLQSAGSTDAFLVKYDPDGTVVWARRGGSDQGDLAYGVAVDDDGRAHVSGSFRGVALFGTLPVQSAGVSDVFVVQYDADGDPAWVEGIGADGSEFTRGGGIGLGSDGSVFVQGSFSNTILVGSDVLASTGFTDIFVAKLTAEGEEVWGRRGGGDGTNFSAALAVDASGNVLATGYTDGTGTFADTPIATQGRDGYFAVFDAGGELVTVELLGGTGQDAGTGVAVSDALGRFAATGSFRGTADFGDLDLTSAGSSDAYLLGGEGFAVVPSVIYVDGDATGANNGSTWTDAFTDLQDALALASEIDVDPLAIWVAEGIYYPTDDNDRTVSFELVDGIEFYGGFDGSETQLHQRDWDVHETVLSGDIDSDGTPDGNSYSVIRLRNANAVVIDGVIVADGFGSGELFGNESEYKSRGAGLQIRDAAVTVRNSDFKNHQVWGDISGGEYFGLGAGIYSESSTLVIENVRFVGNSGTYPSSGGGLYSIDSNVAISQTQFIENQAGLSGGGAHFAGGEVTLIASSFISNSSSGGIPTPSFGGEGGGIYLEGLSASSVLSDLLVEDNYSRNLGGGFFTSQSSATLRRLLIVDNVSASGAGLHESESSSVLLDVEFTRNTATGWQGGALHAVASTPTLVNVRAVGNFAPAVGGALATNLDSHPLLINCSLVGNRAGGAGGAVSAGGDLTLINTTVTANEASSESGGLEIYGGVTTLRNSIVWRNSLDDVALIGSATLDADRNIIDGGCPQEGDCSAVLKDSPLFTSRPSPGDDGEWGTEDDDYGDLRLQGGSPAVDFGLAEFLPPDTFDLDEDGDTDEPLPIDLDDSPRVQGNEVDLGAYESPFTVALEPGTGQPTATTLGAAYPNPLRDHTTLALDLAKAQTVTVEVFDVLGRRVAVVHDGPLEVGKHRVVIEAGTFPAGVYVVRAEGEAFSHSQRLTVVR